MTKSKIVTATVIGTIALFVFGAIFQAIPNLGIGSVENMTAHTISVDNFNGSTNGMAYITTDKAVSFVASRPVGYYNLTKFFIIEIMSVFAISLLFAISFSKMGQTKLTHRLLLTLVFALIGTFAIHIPYYNWWGFSSSYTIGVTLRTIIGWMLVAYIQNRLIYKIK